MAAERIEVEQSLESLTEAIYRRDQNHDDPSQAELDELIRDLVYVAPEPLVDEEFVREDEFACRSCHLILHRTKLADRRRLLCSDCADGTSSAVSKRRGRSGAASQPGL
jgi:hypothetical protein